MNSNSHYNTMSSSATANYWGAGSGQVTGTNATNTSSQYYPSQPAYSQQQNHQNAHQHHYAQHQQSASQYGQPAYQTQSALTTAPNQTSVGQYIPYIPQQQSGQYQPHVQGQYQPQLKQGQYQPQPSQGQYQAQQKQGQYQPQQRQGQYQPQQRQGQYEPQQKQGPYQPHQRQQGQYQPQLRQEQCKPQSQGHSHQQRANHPALQSNMSMSHHQGNSGNGNTFRDRPPAGEYKDLKERSINTCREFMKGFCSKSEDRCRFAHPPPFVDVKNGKVTVCFDFVKNRCQRTQPPCKYMHPPRHLWPDFGNSGGNDGAPRNVPRGNDHNTGSYGCDQRGQYQNRDMGRMDHGARNGPPRNLQGDGQRTNEIGACRDFLRNNCTRHECKFAHPPPHVKVVNGRVTYCFNFLRGSCQRDDCKYFHIPEHLSSKFGRNERRGQKRTHDMRDDRKDNDDIPADCDKYPHYVPEMPQKNTIDDTPADCDKYPHYVPEMPQENTIDASESATQQADSEDVDKAKEDCSETEILESAAYGTTTEDTCNAEEVETATEEEIEVELDNEEDVENPQASEEEFQDVIGNVDDDDDDSHLKGPPENG